MRALRSEHLFHGGEVRSWLYTILTNLNRNRLRSLARRPTLSPLEDNDAPDLAGPEAGGRDIERALATLVEDQRNALAAGGAGRPHLPRSRGGARRADRHRDVASGARARADQKLSRRRAPGAAPREMREKVRPMIDRNSPVTEDELHAYVDGELPADRQEAVAAWLAAHPEQAALVAAWRAQAEAIRARYGAVANEPVPERFKLDHLMRQGRASGAGPGRRWPPPRPSWRSWSAAAPAGWRAARRPPRRTASTPSPPTRSTPTSSTWSRCVIRSKCRAASGRT